MNTNQEFEIKSTLNGRPLASDSGLVDPAFGLHRGFSTGGLPLWTKFRPSGRDKSANPFVTAAHDCRAIFQQGDVDDLPVSQ
jgi:hypothetical protein